MDVVSKLFVRVIQKSCIKGNIYSCIVGSRQYSSFIDYDEDVEEPRERNQRRSSFQGDRQQSSRFGQRPGYQQGGFYDREYEQNNSYQRYGQQRFGSGQSRYEQSYSRYDSPRYGQNRFPEMRGRSRGYSIDIPEVNWDKINLPPIKKDIYIEPDIVKNQDTNEVKEFRATHEITVNGDQKNLNPIMKFSHYSFPEPLQKSLELMKFDAPLPIQSVAWPLLLTGNDLIGIGETGSGKTLAFTLPAIAHGLQQNSVGPNVVVLAPTRELAQQIYSVFMSADQFAGVKSVCVYGGASKMAQSQKIRQRPMVVIATPGRLMDLMADGLVNLQTCTYLVLDEADRMLDMGFEPQIQNILKQVRPDRQTLMFSATWPSDVQKLARRYTQKPIHVTIGSSELSANRNITQEICVCSSSQKNSKLIMELKRAENGSQKCLIFVETKRGADELSYIIQSETGLKAKALHGGLSQGARDGVVHGFRGGYISIVVATDVASRGLDVSDIGLVVNYDMPKDVDSYIHRIGRTARAGKTGKSLSFFTSHNRDLAGDIVKLLRKNKQEIPEELLHFTRPGRY